MEINRLRAELALVKIERAGVADQRAVPGSARERGGLP
jgi:hypothetical protein